ncbi:MAG: transketolase C-terminal domain-containing protein [Planctomycetaceae bacterium]
MRDAFARELLRLAGLDDRIVMLSGDIGNRLFDDFKARFPSRFFNCGVAEANMMGTAAGMAASGLRPVVYTIVPFVTTRCLEQIRVDVCYHNVPVTIVGVGGGLSYAGLGATHHSCEDIGFLRLLPNMTVICPADAIETRLALAAALAHDGPVYIRLGKKGEPLVHAKDPEFRIGKAITVRPGDDVAIIGTGNLLPTALEAAKLLAGHKVSARVVSMHTVKPLDVDALAAAFASCALVVTVEEHSRIGGLGGAIAEWLADRGPQRARLVRIGTDDRFLHEGGDQDYARRQFGLDAQSIAQSVLSQYRAALGDGATS